MGAAELETKVALAERTRSYDACAELLQYVRKEKLRVPRVVAKFGSLLIQNYSWRLGSDSTWRWLTWGRGCRKYHAGGVCV
jgi:hypothetical protein